MPEELTQAYPLHVFRFWVDFQEDRLGQGPGDAVALCSGQFAECTGLEATMEPKVIKEGGRNYGAAQRAGPVTFATVVLKRGMTHNRGLWKWYAMATTRGATSYRLTVTITLFDNAGNAVLAWQLVRAMPVKFKSADFNARNPEVGVEELHLAHEGLYFVPTPERRQLWQTR